MEAEKIEQQQEEEQEEQQEGSRKACAEEHPGERQEVRAEPNPERCLTFPGETAGVRGTRLPALSFVMVTLARACRGAALGLARTGAPQHRPKAFPPPPLAGSALLTLRAAGRWRWKLAKWKRGSFPTRIPT